MHWAGNRGFKISLEKKSRRKNKPCYNKSYHSGDLYLTRKFSAQTMAHLFPTIFNTTAFQANKRISTGSWSRLQRDLTYIEKRAAELQIPKRGGDLCK